MPYEEMDKYAVDESTDTAAKTAQSLDKCPLCGRALERHGPVVLCPVHGSQPFE